MYALDLKLLFTLGLNYWKGKYGPKCRVGKYVYFSYDNKNSVNLFQYHNIKNVRNLLWRLLKKRKKNRVKGSIRKVDLNQIDQPSSYMIVNEYSIPG